MIKINTIEIKTYDSLEYLKTIESKSIGLAIYDAPYFSTGIKEVGDKQWKTEEEYINWCLEIIKETQRVLKDNGSFYWFHNDINIMVEILHRVKHETEFKLKNQITWDKVATGNQDFLMPLYKNSKIKSRYATSLTEYIYYFTFEEDSGLNKIINKSNYTSVSEKLRKYIDDNFTREYVIELFLKEGRYTSDASAKVHASYKMGWNNGQRFDLMDEKMFDYLNSYLNFSFTYNELREEYNKIKEQLILERYEFNQPYLITPKYIEESRNVIRPYTTVWQYAREEDIYKLHITPKPVKMIKHIIEVSSRNGDTILDIFSGSGTSSLATLEVGNRNFKGCDMNLEFNKIAKTRLNTYISEYNLQDIEIKMS